MGKNKKRKRNHLAFLRSHTAGSKPETNGSAAPDDKQCENGDGTSNASISDEHLRITLETLAVLAADPPRLKEKRFKDLRRLLHPLVAERLASYETGTDYRLKATKALQHQKWSDALAALRGCRDFQQIPKQGTVQRWVRDCDTAPGSCKLALLHAVLQASNASGGNPSEQGDASNKHDPRRALAEHSSMVAEDDASNRDAAATSSSHEGLTLLEDWSVGRRRMDPDDPDELPAVSPDSRILYREEAARRTPPNHYDLLLHTTRPGCVAWDNDDQTRGAIRKHPVPFLPAGSAFLLENVFSVAECTRLRAAATALGFRPDHPTTSERPTGIDSCEWLVDASILGVLNDRVRAFLPTSIGEPISINNDSKAADDDEDGGDNEGSGPNGAAKRVEFHSINPRWRFFRYGQGCVYRPHIDGSWPASRINEKGEYESDTSGSTRSYLTFLVYLNDNFEGGPTRFYVSNSSGLLARGVAPRCGSCLVFRQGNTASLLHEGAAVTRGVKYVVRTDVLYHLR